MTRGRSKGDHRKIILASICAFAVLSLVFVLRDEHKEEKYVFNVIKDLPRERPVNQRETDTVVTKHLDTNKSLYVIVLDTNYSAQDYHCISKNLWMDKLKSLDFVSGLDIYSPTGWINEKCDLNSIGIKIPPNITNPDISSSLLHSILKMVYQQVNSSSFLIISDATYVDMRKAGEYLQSFVNKDSIMASGVCIEQRYFFQTLHLGAGILIKRSILSKILSHQYIWEMCEKTGISSQDAIGHLLDASGVTSSHHTSTAFLGNEWKEQSDWTRLTVQKYSTLSKCAVPKYILDFPPGKSGVCVKTPGKMSDVIFWAGYNEYNKLWFTENAKVILETIPESIGFYWNRLHPTLCNTSIV